jgi:hypothetical protein
MRRSLILLQLEDMILIVSVDVSITAIYLIHQWLKLLDLRINVVARMVPPISKYKIVQIRRFASSSIGHNIFSDKENYRYQDRLAFHRSDI